MHTQGREGRINFDEFKQKKGENRPKIPYNLKKNYFSAVKREVGRSGK